MQSFSLLDFQASSIANSRILVSGKSGTGKTTIIKHILNIAKECVPSILLVSQTECSNGSFQSIVPEELIIPTFSMDDKSDSEKTSPFIKAQRHIKHIYNRQELLTKRYNRTKNIDILRSIFDKIDVPEDSKIKSEIGHIERAKQLYYTSTKRQDPTNIEARMNQYNLTVYNVELSKLLKDYISKYGDKAKNMTEAETAVYNDININPNLVIVIDDCASLLKSYWKIPEFKNMFNNGRHVHLTMIVCAQNTTDSEKAMRTQCNIKIFTTASSAIQLIKSDHSDQQKELIPSIENVFKARDASKRLYYCFVLTDDKSGAFLAKSDLIFDYNPRLTEYFKLLRQAKTKQVEASSTSTIVI
jgi:hypothetical protein